MELQDLGTGGIITFVVAAFAVVGFLKGLVRIVFALVSLIASLTAGYFTWKHGLWHIRQYWEGAPDSSAWVAAALVTVISFFILHKLFSFLINPFQESSLINKVAFGLPASLLCGAIAIVGMLFGLNQLRQHSEHDDLAYWSQMLSGETPSFSLRSKINHFIDSSNIGEKLASLDPLYDREKWTLLQLSLVKQLDGDIYESLLKNDEITKVLRHPKVWNLISSDEQFAELIRSGDTNAIANYPAIEEILNDPQLRQDIQQINIDETLKLR